MKTKYNEPAPYEFTRVCQYISCLQTKITTRLQHPPADEGLLKEFRKLTVSKGYIEAGLDTLALYERVFGKPPLHVIEIAKSHRQDSVTQTIITKKANVDVVAFIKREVAK